jgi:hypothetical protein
MARGAVAALVAALVLLAAAGPSAAAAPTPRAPTVGIADQKPEMFTDPLFTGLGVRTARLVVPWDVMVVGWQRDALRAWLEAARAAGVSPLLTFGHSRRPGQEKRRPTPAELQHQFRRLRVNYPWVRDWATWNEPNHCGEPLCHRPELAARYFDALRRACPSCRVLAAEVLDTPNMAAWVRSFRRAARVEPRYWGLHNYVDANRLRTSGTRALLRATKGEVWFTETGGIVSRTARVRIPFPESTAHAAIATRWLFDKLVPLSSRIRRVYLYHWNPSGPRDTWDSALLDARGRPRAAYRVLRARLAPGRAAVAPR